MTSNLSKLRILATTLLGGAAFAGTLLLSPTARADGDGGADVPAAPKAPDRVERREGRRAMGGRLAERRHRAMRFLRALDLTEGQKAALAEARAAAAPVRADTAAKLGALREKARAARCDGQKPMTDADRAGFRAERKAVVDAARASVEPAAQRIFGSMSAEQKATLAKRAQEHGKTFDDARLLKGIERLLLMPERHGRRRDR